MKTFTRALVGILATGAAIGYLGETKSIYTINQLTGEKSYVFSVYLGKRLMGTIDMCDYGYDLLVKMAEHGLIECYEVTNV